MMLKKEMKTAGCGPEQRLIKMKRKKSLKYSHLSHSSISLRCSKFAERNLGLTFLVAAELDQLFPGWTQDS